MNPTLDKKSVAMTLEGNQYVTAYQGGNRYRVKTDHGVSKPSLLFNFERLVAWDRSQGRNGNLEVIVITRQRSFTGDKILPCGEQIIGPYLTLLQSKGYLFAWISAMELEPVRNDLLKSGYHLSVPGFSPYQICTTYVLCRSRVK